MRKIFGLIILCYGWGHAGAQGRSEIGFYKYEYRNSMGLYKLTIYDTNIVKITFTPKSYQRNEHISDAVILEPGKKTATIANRFHSDSVILTHLTTRLALVSDSAEANWGFQFGLKEGEKIFGGGERALPLNRRGYRLNLYNNPWYGYGEGADNLNYSVPFITSSNGYGLFFDNPSRGYLDIGKMKSDVLQYGASSGEINVYVIFGDYQTILQSYHRLTGKQPLPPRWAFGNLMSRFGYTSEAQVKEILQKMKSENIPVDAVIFDLFWFGDSIKQTLGNLEWVNKTKWPDPKKMIADFKKEGIQTILVTEPFFVETSKNYRASKKYLAVDSSGKNPYYLTDFYFGHGGLIDIFRNDSKAWFWQFYKKQMQNGVEAWWGDLGEPERHPSNMYHNLKDLGYKRLFKADEVHNIYGHNWTKMLYQYYAKEYPNKRLFSLNRSGFAGSQRYSIFPWTGDVSRSWTGLRAQLGVLLGMSMSGVPYVHSDAGGFAGGEGDNELYVRWLQFAAFTPIFRPHGTALYEVDPGAFSFPSEAALVDTPYRDYANDAIRMRYRMLPYNYSLAYQQARYGKPLMAPLYYYFQNDTTAANIQDEFMWGEAFLVAPILEKNSVVRKYYVPEGRWYHPEKKVFLEGMSWQADSASLKQIPVLVRAGSFIPFDGRAIRSDNTSAFTDSLIAMTYTPSVDSSSYDLFLDDGISKNSIQTNAYELIQFTCSGKKKNTTEFTISSKHRNASTKPSPHKLALIIEPSTLPSTITINGKKLKRLGERFFLENGKPGAVMEKETLILFVDFVSAPLSINLSW